MRTLDISFFLSNLIYNVGDDSVCFHDFMNRKVSGDGLSGAMP